MRGISVTERNYIEANCRHRSGHQLVTMKAIFKNRTVWFVMCMYFCLQWSNYFLLHGCPFTCRKEGILVNSNQARSFFFVHCRYCRTALWWILRRLDCEKRGLKFGRRFVGITGMGMCGLMVFLAALLANNELSAGCLIAANFSYSFAVMTAYAVCSDIGRNNTGTVTGAMNFFRANGRILPGIDIWKNC